MESESPSPNVRAWVYRIIAIIFECNLFHLPFSISLKWGGAPKLSLCLGPTVDFHPTGLMVQCKSKIMWVAQNWRYQGYRGQPSRDWETIYYQVLTYIRWILGICLYYIISWAHWQFPNVLSTTDPCPLKPWPCHCVAVWILRALGWGMSASREILKRPRTRQLCLVMLYPALTGTAQKQMP